jgi:hypothetical protein
MKSQNEAEGRLSAETMLVHIWRRLGGGFLSATTHRIAMPVRALISEILTFRAVERSN